MLAHGVSVDVVDDYVQIGELTAIECLKEKSRTLFYYSKKISVKAKFK